MDQPTSPYRLMQPDQQTIPVVVNSPHSGDYYPPDFLDESRLCKSTIRKSEDFRVDMLARGAVSQGIPLLAASYPRAYVDMNREPFELDQSMFSEELPSFANTQSLRVAGGLGTIPKIVAENAEIYRGKIPVSSAIDRINNIYRPYHEMLQTLLAKTHVRFGVSVLLDFHSMPSTGLAAIHGEKADIVLGDRFGTSCSPALLHHVRELLTNLGYTVAVNRPYAGGFITEHYGRPLSGLHALQIEINRGLYMDEVRISENRFFNSLQSSFDTFFTQFGRLDFSLLQGTQPLAAE